MKSNTLLTLTIKLDTGNPRGMRMLNGIAGAIAKELSVKQRADMLKQLHRESERLGRIGEGKRNAQRRKAGKARSKRRVFSEEMGVK